MTQFQRIVLGIAIISFVLFVVSSAIIDSQKPDNYCKVVKEQMDIDGRKIHGFARGYINGKPDFVYVSSESVEKSMEECGRLLIEYTKEPSNQQGAP